jgi:hypothetical protein
LQLATCLAIAVFSGEARAAPPARLSVTSTDACPSPAMVAAALHRVFPEVAIVSAGPGLPSVAVAELGAVFRVEVAGEARSFSDAARRCVERANTAAAFASLVLDPPEVDIALPERPVAVVPRAVALPSVALQVGALFSAAPRLGHDNSLIAGGGTLRLFVGSRRVGGVVGVSAVSPATLDFPAAHARVLRFPIDAGVRGRLHRGPWSFVADLELLSTAIVIGGRSVSDPKQSSGIELGLRVAAQAELAVGHRLAPFLALEAQVLPREHELVVAGTGAIGTTPPLWLGVALGLSFDLR